MPAYFTRIYLTGFMGAGKTTVGRILASRLAWQFYDIDALIESERGSSIASLFATHGEPAFRQMEHDMIQGLQNFQQTVISLGGGALETAKVREIVYGQADSHVVFLDAPLARLIERCVAQDGGSGRPILADRTHLGERYRLRRAQYEKAHLIVATQSLTPEEVAASIEYSLAALQNGNPSNHLL